MARLIDSARALRGTTPLMTRQAPGPRVSEVCGFLAGNIESFADHLCIKLCQCRGGKVATGYRRRVCLIALRTWRHGIPLPQPCNRVPAPAWPCTKFAAARQKIVFIGPEVKPCSWHVKADERGDKVLHSPWHNRTTPNVPSPYSCAMNTPETQDETSPYPLPASSPGTPVTVVSALDLKPALLFGYDPAPVRAAREAADIAPDKRRALFVAERGRVDFVYNTAALEGNPLTFPEIQTLLDGITVGGHRLSDAEQVLRLNHALSFCSGSGERQCL